MTHFLYDVAAHPECVQPLRDEIESLVHAQGWTKESMGKLDKLDSFMRESQRYNGISGSTQLIFIPHCDTHLTSCLQFPL